MYNKKGTQIGKTIGDNTEGFKVRISQHICDFKTGVSIYKFLSYLFDCGGKNYCPEEPF